MHMYLKVYPVHNLDSKWAILFNKGSEVLSNSIYSVVNYDKDDNTFPLGPSTVICVAVYAWIVVISPSVIPYVSLITLAKGARQLVVQEALLERERERGGALTQSLPLLIQYKTVTQITKATTLLQHIIIPNPAILLQMYCIKINQGSRKTCNIRNF